MSANAHLLLNSVVWATVPEQPAWPAKIVKKLCQNNKTVYKVHFFGDPSYCYLYEDSIQPFTCAQFESEQISESQVERKRAFELAKNYFSKQMQQKQLLQIQVCSLQPCQAKCSITCEQTQVCSKQHIDLPQKMQQVGTQIECQPDKVDCSFESITQKNVMELLGCYKQRKDSILRENLKRKQIISLQSQLKYNLLLKYDLENIPNFKETSHSQGNISLPLKQKRINRKQKNKYVKIQYSQIQQCMRKLQRILMQKGLQNGMAIRLASYLVEKMAKAVQFADKGSKNTFLWEFMHFLREIAHKIENIEDAQYEYLEKKLSSFIDLQTPVEKNEQRSKTTHYMETPTPDLIFCQNK